ncbi:MAG: hypothetical protein V4760_08540 [Bdellovibrionota bacterium]
MIRLLMITVLVMASTFQAEAAKSKSVTKQKTKQVQKVEAENETDGASFAPKKGRLGTDFSFAGSRVDGKFLSAGDSIAEVEDEKEMGALIGIRKNFRDRLGAERARLKSEGK